ncbi:aldehyde dehydrogenase [Streptomyces mirabilis]|uniref:aldehyde dehydrogenase n=1 Tax=Streptomyces mirabilis TaxID=68239 RepID=UPI0021C24E18|nr:aldehyde dehydrogenase [Streptomyces mirabilis]MCT9114167.1 aldehyde dehydrogenase [Streptomyces mirabilis]
MNPHHLFIGGRWVHTSGDRVINAVSASTGDHLGAVPDGSREDIDRAVGAAPAAFDAPAGWASWGTERRAAAMIRLADALDARKEATSDAVSAQNGMPITVARSFEGVVPSALLRYYAMTWNFPQTIAFFKIAPALAAGCVLVLKPAPETVLDSVLLAEAIQEAGIPDGVINIVPGGRDTGAYLVSHPDIDKVSFTGSTRAGRQVAAACAELLRPVTLELGGKSAAVVLDDADLAANSEQFFMASLLNNGQTCYASTRILASRSRYREVVEFCTAMARDAVVGDALDPDTQIGPLVSQRQRERVLGYIKTGLNEGARLTTGGGRPSGLDRGWFVEPTVFADVENSSTIAQEEIFGPVLTITSYDGEDEAVRLANESAYGLAGTVWTTDLDHGAQVARRFRTGTVGLNGYLPDLTSPYGGRKASGLGTELGPEGLHAYQQVQSIYHP